MSDEWDAVVCSACAKKAEGVTVRVWAKSKRVVRTEKHFWCPECAKPCDGPAVVISEEPDGSPEEKRKWDSNGERP